MFHRRIGNTRGWLLWLLPWQWWFARPWMEICRYRTSPQVAGVSEAHKRDDAIRKTSTSTNRQDAPQQQAEKWNKSSRWRWASSHSSRRTRGRIPLKRVWYRRTEQVAPQALYEPASLWYYLVGDAMVLTCPFPSENVLGITFGGTILTGFVTGSFV